MTIEIAERLVALRKAHGFSQEDLAARLGVSRQAVSKWERAESAPDTDNMIALAELYGVSLDDLIHGENAAPQPAAMEPGDADDPLPNGSYFQHKAEEEAREVERRRLSFPYAAIVAIIYLVLGACFNMWHPAWLLFFTIPLYYMPKSQRHPLRMIGHPVMVTLIYLILGFYCHLWHPGWVVFLLIPVVHLLPLK